MGNNPSKSGGQAPTSPVTNHSAHPQTRKEVFVNAQRSSPVSSQSSHATTQHVTSPSSYRHSREDSKMGNEQSRVRWRDRGDAKSKEKSSSAPLKVPRGSDPKRQKGPDTQFEPSGPPKDPNYIPRSNLNFPPRLPLPIEEETHTPGSPILAATGESVEVKEEQDFTGLLPRNNTWASASDAPTEEDDEVNGFQPLTTEGPTKPVQTVIEWRQPGEKVYVTGSFTHWGRKHRLTRE